MDMKRIILIFAVLSVLLPVHAQGIKAGPWISGVREDTVTILWTSDQPGLAWLELEDGTQKYETFAGRRIFGSLHSIRLDGLRPGQTVRYRACGQVLTDDSNARKPVFGDCYAGCWHTVRTFDAAAPSCRFSIFNDIHMRVREFRKLAAQVDSAGTDFIFYNGDIVSAGNYVADTLVHYAIEPLGTLANGLPLMFARGNHEGRGNNLKLIADVYPQPSEAPFYYTFREGPVAFVVFDAGETGQSRSYLFSGGPVYEDYLREQIACARKVLFDADFRDAPVKICLLHVPMIDHPDQTDYLLQRWLNKEMVPMLNEAGIDLMIGADLHEFMMCEAGTMGNAFPIVVNDDARRMDVRCADGVVSLQMYAPSGKLEFERSFSIDD